MDFESLKKTGGSPALSQKPDFESPKKPGDSPASRGMDFESLKKAVTNWLISENALFRLTDLHSWRAAVDKYLK